jgi:hypothetical protein
MLPPGDPPPLLDANSYKKKAFQIYQKVFTSLRIDNSDNFRQ